MTLSRELETVLAPRVKALRTIWIAFSSAPLLYMGLAYLVTMSVSPEQVEESTAALPLSSTTMLGIGLAVAAVIALVSFHLRARLTSEEALSAAVTSPPKSTRFAGVPESARPVTSAFARLQISCVIVWSIQESIVLIGLVLVFVTYVFVNIVPFAIVAALLLVASRPKDDVITDRLGAIARRFETDGSVS